MRVLCGTDFSAFAQDATTLAARWSARAGADLHLIHVCSHDEALELRRDHLAREGSRLATLGASIGGLDVVLGDPAEVLLQEAEYRGAGMIVLGAVGQHGVERWLTGSVTTRVARDAPVPVLVARSIEPLEAWLRSGEQLRVVTGFERGESTRSALYWVSQLARLGPVDLTIVQLVIPGPENRKAHATGTGLGLTLKPEVEQQLVEELRAGVGPIIGEMPARLMIQSALGRRDVALVMQAQELNAGLLVVGSHQRQGFQRWWSGSVSHGVLNAATTSVAVVPSRTGAE
jgi:nucleotide-binding universal stress UspA family protein